MDISFFHLAISDLSEALDAMEEVNTMYRDGFNDRDKRSADDSEHRSTFLNAVRGLRMVNETENEYGRQNLS